MSKQFVRVCLKDGHWVHTTADGGKIRVSEMTTSHLLNTINFLRRMANEGIQVQRTFALSSRDDYEQHITPVPSVLVGEAALEVLRVGVYEQEAKFRGLKHGDNP